MDKTTIKKPKTISKKELLREIIELDDRFDTNSLTRTNLNNIKAIHSLLMADKRLLERQPDGLGAVDSAPISHMGEKLMDSINITFGFFAGFLIWMAIDQLLIFQFDTSLGELIKKLYTKLFK